VLRSTLGLIGRSLVVGLGYAFTLIVAGLIVSLLGLTPPDIAARVDPQTSLASRLLGGILLGLFLGPLSRHLRVPAGERVAVLFAVVLIVNNLVNLIEGLYFTTFFEHGVASTLVTMVLGSAGLSALIAALFRPRAIDEQLGVALHGTFVTRRPWSWVWRIGLASLLYLPTYFFFGSLVIPFVRPYYEDPSLGAGVRLPAFEVIVPLEVVRGLLYVLTLLPLVALLRGPRWRLALWLAAIIAALNAWEPLLTNTLWPLTMRVAHGLEITADAFVQGVTIAWLLGCPSRGKDVEETAAT